MVENFKELQQKAKKPKIPLETEPEEKTTTTSTTEQQINYLRMDMQRIKKHIKELTTITQQQERTTAKNITKRVMEFYQEIQQRDQQLQQQKTEINYTLKNIHQEEGQTSRYQVIQTLKQQLQQTLNTINQDQITFQTIKLQVREILEILAEHIKQNKFVGTI